MTSKWHLTLSGCDDSTTITVDLEEKELLLLKLLAEMFEKASASQCMPTLDLEPAND